MVYGVTKAEELIPSSSEGRLLREREGKEGGRGEGGRGEGGREEGGRERGREGESERGREQERGRE